MVKKRDPKVVERFLRKQGLTKIPKGKEVDHKVPLVNGGSDTVRNLQLTHPSLRPCFPARMGLNHGPCHPGALTR